MHNETKSIIKGKICNILPNANNQFKQLRDQPSSQYNYYYKKHFSEANFNSLILQANKCNKTVIKLITEYLTKMISLLDDASYKK